MLGREIFYLYLFLEEQKSYNKTHDSQRCKDDGDVTCPLVEPKPKNHCGDEGEESNPGKFFGAEGHELWGEKVNAYFLLYIRLGSQCKTCFLMGLKKRGGMRTGKVGIGNRGKKGQKSNIFSRYVIPKYRYPFDVTKILEKLRIFIASQVKNQRKSNIYNQNH